MEASLKRLVIVAALMGLAIMSRPMSANGDGLCGMTGDGFKACGPAVRPVTVGSPISADPTALCCSALSNSDPACLCYYMKRYPGFMAMYNVDPTLAFQLPAKCKIQDSFHC